MQTLIANDKVKLVYTQKDDLPFVLEAEREASLTGYVGLWPLEKHEATLTNPDELHLIVVNNAGDRVGYVILRELTNENNRLELFRITITAKGQGYGEATLRLIKKWSFEVKKVNRLWLDVKGHNTANKLYEKIGFVQEGILREAIKFNNGYEPLIIMSILSSEYHREDK